MLDLGRFLLPPTFNLAHGPQLLILFFDSIEYSHEDVSYCLLSGYLSLSILVFFSVKLFNFGSLLHLAKEALHSHLLFAFCVCAKHYIQLSLIFRLHHVDTILDGFT